MTHQPTPRIKKDWAKREWRSIVSNSDFFQSDIRRVTKKIDSELSEPTENEFGKYLSGSASLAALTAAHAIEMFDASRVDMGWELIATSLQYFLTEFKLDFAMGFSHAHPGVMNRASLIYCTALATKSRSVGEWTARFLVETEAKQGSKLRPQPPNEFECLCFQLAAETIGVKAKPEWSTATGMGMYYPLWSADSIRDIQDAIDLLAVNRAALSLELLNDYPPFETLPFTLFPVEILAVLLIRHAEQIHFDFGCIESPLCHPPAEIGWGKPRLLARLEDRIRERYDFPEVDWE
jgi:hypothetical protein